MTYREALPEGCPPLESSEVITDRDFFRLVLQKPPTNDDFKSERAKRPKTTFRVTECRARGLSVFAERPDCENARKLPRLKATLVCRVRLAAGAGQIQHTGPRSHHTWWPLADFDILTRCVVESA